jgi:hypothetical protein
VVLEAVYDRGQIVERSARGAFEQSLQHSPRQWVRFLVPPWRRKREILERRLCFEGNQLF